MTKQIDQVTDKTARAVLMGYGYALEDLELVSQLYLKELPLEPSQKSLVEDFADFAKDFLLKKHKTMLKTANLMQSIY